jgi:hypothetical protein
MSSVNPVAAFAADVDPRISYPCYKSFDDLIDVEHLKSLDSYIAERVRRHAQGQKDEYFQNDHRLDADSPHEPGVREIWLSRNKPHVAYEYLNLDDPDCWEPSKEAEEFPLLMDFIATLPFKATGRMLIIYDEGTHSVPPHRDHLHPELCHEFVWLRTRTNKPFFVLNHKTNEKRYVECYSAWFDTVNQFHGTDVSRGLSFSIRVDGLFTEELSNRIPTAVGNPASRAALWACLATEENGQQPRRSRS